MISANIVNNRLMKFSISVLHQMAGIITAAMVMVATGIVLWGKPLLWEAFAWQLLILVCVVFITMPNIASNLSSKLTNTPILKAALKPVAAHSTIGRVFLWVMLVAVFALSWRVPVDIFFIYTIIWMACCAYHMSKGAAWLWLVLITVGWLLIHQYAWNDQNGPIDTLLIGTFHLFALLSSLTAKEAAEANERTQRLNRELVATQHLLGEASRESERTRIARDLHDLLGHHLTALTINLQVASHTANGSAKEKIDQCYGLSKLLLSDVREAVSELRAMPVVDAKHLLELVLTDLPRVKVDLEVQQGLQIHDVNTGQIILRTVQEALTNTLKHTDADRVKIRLHSEQRQLKLTYTDSGTIAGQLEFGNGLIGMKERIAKVGGQLTITSSGALSLQASIPLST